MGKKNYPEPPLSEPLILDFLRDFDQFKAWLEYTKAEMDALQSKRIKTVKDFEEMLRKRSEWYKEGTANFRQLMNSLARLKEAAKTKKLREQLNKISDDLESMEGLVNDFLSKIHLP